jgi:hypothetical protein
MYGPSDNDLGQMFATASGTFLPAFGGYIACQQAGTNAAGQSAAKSGEVTGITFFRMLATAPNPLQIYVPVLPSPTSTGPSFVGTNGSWGDIRPNATIGLKSLEDIEPEFSGGAAALVITQDINIDSGTQAGTQGHTTTTYENVGPVKGAKTVKAYGQATLQTILASSFYEPPTTTVASTKTNGLWTALVPTSQAIASANASNGQTRTDLNSAQPDYAKRIAKINTILQQQATGIQVLRAAGITVEEI